MIKKHFYQYILPEKQKQQAPKYRVMPATKQLRIAAKNQPGNEKPTAANGTSICQRIKQPI
jgi:hypothetical protein